MQDYERELSSLNTEVKNALLRLQIDKLQEELKSLDEQSVDPDLWNDRRAAEDLMSRRSKLAVKVEPWVSLDKNVSYALELAGLHDPSLEAELQQQLSTLQADYERLMGQLKLNGPYDEDDAILSVYAGAGGTDAQDWAEMLHRMYVRYCEKQSFKLSTIDQSVGEEAGLKSVTIQVSGPFAYGKLKSEHGVHRLVRLSPFNSDNLRQTSFAKVEILPKIDKPELVVLDDKDLKIDVYRAGGHGGQSVNTTDSAVRVTHLPTGLVVAIQNERSQVQNKETAMTILRSRLAQLQLEQHTASVAELKGPNLSAEWGNQIRNYVLHPYKMVKDVRTKYESSDPNAVLDGEIEPFIQAYLDQNVK